MTAAVHWLELNTAIGIAHFQKWYSGQDIRMEDLKNKHKMTDLFTHIENNTESQTHFEENKIHFSKQCETVLSLLMRGYEITSYSAMVEHNIGHLARRLKDLKDAGIKISERWNPQARVKIWYCSQEDKAHNEKIRG